MYLLVSARGKDGAAHANAQPQRHSSEKGGSTHGLKLQHLFVTQKQLVFPGCTGNYRADRGARKLTTGSDSRAALQRNIVLLAQTD